MVRWEELHRLAPSPLPFDRNLDHIGPIRRNCFCQGRCNGVGRIDPHAFDTHSSGQVYEIKLRPRQIHVLIRMLRPGFELLTPNVHIVLEDAILPVRQNDEHDCKFVVGRGPKRLDAVHR